MAHPVIGPADDTVSFVQPRGLVFVTMLWVIAAAWAACYGLYLLVRLLLDRPPGADDIAGIAESLLLVPAIGAGVILVLSWNRFGHLHSNVHGLEFAATGRRAVSLPWSAVASVGLRRSGPFTELIVTPADPGAVTVGPGPGRRPRTRRRGAEVSYVVDVGLMSPGPATLLAELHRRIPAKV